MDNDIGLYYLYINTKAIRRDKRIKDQNPRITGSNCSCALKRISLSKDCNMLDAGLQGTHTHNGKPFRGFRAMEFDLHKHSREQFELMKR